MNAVENTWLVSYQDIFNLAAAKIGISQPDWNVSLECTHIHLCCANYDCFSKCRVKVVRSYRQIQDVRMRIGFDGFKILEQQMRINPNSYFVLAMLSWADLTSSRWELWHYLSTLTGAQRLQLYFYSYAFKIIHHREVPYINAIIHPLEVIVGDYVRDEYLICANDIFNSLNLESIGNHSTENWKKPEGTITYLQKLGGSFDSKMTLDTPRRLPTGRHDAPAGVKERLYAHSPF